MIRFRTLIALCLALLLPAPGETPVADLRGADFEAGTIPLDGNWEMAHAELLLPSDPGWERPGKKLVGALPWARIGLPSEGFATYRLTLLLDTSRVRRLAFSLKEDGSAHALWADGRRVFGAGRVGRSLAEEIPEYAYRTGEIDVRSPRVELVFQTSNFHGDNGGLFYPIRVGAPRTVQKFLAFHTILQSIVVGMFLLFGFQHLLAWLPGRKDSASLLFALFCLVWAVCSICESTEPRLLTLLFDLPFEAFNRANFLALIAMPPLMSLFAEALFPDRLLRRVNQVLLGLAAVCTAAVLFLPLRSYVLPAGLYFSLSCLVLVPVVRTCVRGWRVGLPHAGLFAAGYAAFMATAFHDQIRYAGWIQSRYVMSYGAAVLVICQAVILSRRSSATRAANDRLLAEVQAQNAELDRLARVKDDFLANVTHELRTPLHAIAGIAESAEEGAPPRQRADFRSILGSARRLARLVDDLLDFSRLRHADIALRPEPVDLQALADRVRENLRSLATRKEIGFEVALDEELPPVEADPDRLEQVLFNLAGNAIKFTEKGRVRLSAESAPNGKVRIAVSDTGPGVAPEDRARIFEAFEQGKAARGGTGLGLSISRRLVELHGSRLELESVPGEGATFAFEIPASAGPAPEGPKVGSAIRGGSPLPDEPETEPESEPESGSVRAVVLAVDDEAANLRVLRNHLRPMGAKFVGLESGDGLLARIAAEKPDVVLLDVGLPGRDGFELCREIREVHPQAELPVLFVTARNRLDDLVRGYEAGGNDYLVKPFLKAELLARLELHLRQRDRVVELLEPARRAGEIVRLAVRIWEASTGQGKVDFAEACGAWSIQVDANGWRRTQTLDRYLRAEREPNRPRWAPVLDSARFVLEQARLQGWESPDLDRLRGLVASGAGEG